MLFPTVFGCSVSTVAFIYILPTTEAKLYASPSQLPGGKTYDFIVIGASPNTPLDWNYTTIPQAFLHNRTMAYPRGKLLGGSTSINYMTSTRGSADDFDRFASVTGDPGWSWKALEPYMKKVERLAPPQDDHSTFGEVDPLIHGTSGPLTITLTGYPLTIDQRIIQTTEQLAEFPYNVDMNSGNTIGFGWTQSTIGNGARVSSVDAYIQPKLDASIPNLDVVINAQVTRLLHSGTVEGLPSFRGVEFASSPKSKRFTLTAAKEVILSAGAINTPQILLLSGIGPPSALSAHSIKTIVELPGVGQNLPDHPLVANHTFAELSLEEWETSKQEPFVGGPAAQIGWFRLPTNSSVFAAHGDPSAGPKSAHFEFLPFDGFVSTTGPPPSSGHYFTIITAAVSPASPVLINPRPGGTVSLASADPFAFPLIDPRFFSHAVDLHVMREAIKAALRFVRAPAWRDYIVAPFGALAVVQTDAEIEEYARENGGSVFHPVGTAAMGRPSDENAVVNPDLTVRGVRGLRVVDASVLPFIPAAHTQAAVYIVAERAADLVKAAHA
ncbi:alcohol oxidase [Artomyces pyxidatus]|uniref:Alcohol oxidase n=1 Tax=Artomyces pyxidatus TaxID=48021 RepID=A0ACB8T7K7_9AGAM|nr:alcohol oxidase [Artomyces pyxidatus]